jgi:hypothetical protein
MVPMHEIAHSGLGKASRTNQAAKQPQRYYPSMGGGYILGGWSSLL